MIHHAITATPVNGPGGIPRAVEKWLPAQNWSSVLAAAADDAPDSLALITHVVHIGLRLAPGTQQGERWPSLTRCSSNGWSKACCTACPTAHEQAVNSTVHALEATTSAMRQPHLVSALATSAQPTLPSQEEAAAHMPWKVRNLPALLPLHPSGRQHVEPPSESP